MQSRPRHLPVAFAAVLLTLGVCFSPVLEQGFGPAGPPYTGVSALDTPTFRIEHRSGSLELSGTVGTADHESALLQLIDEHFGASGTRADLRPGVVLPVAWETASLRLLYALAATESGTAVMENDRITIRGVASDGKALASRLRLLRESIPGDIEIDEDFIVLEDTVALGELCRRSLASALSDPVEFRQSSAELRTSSYAMLDKIIDAANDCRNRRIVITGHTDASGSETWNRRLSLARAQAVADYLINGGIEPDRLIVAGMGSAVPVADNTTSRGRSRNRRIEFELR